MNLVDIIFLIIIAFFFIRGIYRGLLQEVSALAAIILGFFLANRFWKDVLPTVKNIFPLSNAWCNVISYLLVLLGVMFVLFLITTIIKHFLQAISLGWVDNVAGGALGLLKAIILCSIILMSLTLFLPNNSPTLNDSLLAPYVHRASLVIGRLLPAELKHAFERKKRYWERRWQKNFLRGEE